MLLASPIFPTLACTVTVLLVLATARSWLPEGKKLQESALTAAIAVVGVSAFFLGVYREKALLEATSTQPEANLSPTIPTSPTINSPPSPIATMQVENDHPLGESQEQQDHQYDALLDQLEARFPPMNSRSASFNRESVRQLETLVVEFERQGHPGPFALQQAAQQLSGIRLSMPPAPMAVLRRPATPAEAQADAQAAADAAAMAADAAAAAAP